MEWAGAAARTAANREIDVAIPGGTGQGEMWSAGWRWWSHRPGVSVGFAAPRVRSPARRLAVRRVVAIGHLRRRAESRIIESRTHGGLTVSDWLSGHLRYSVTTGLDRLERGTEGRVARRVSGARRISRSPVAVDRRDAVGAVERR